MERLGQTRHHDPGQLLGKHLKGSKEIVRSLVPNAKEVKIAETGIRMSRIKGTDVFEWSGSPNSVPDRFRIVWSDDQGKQHDQLEAYCFPPQISDFDLHLFNEGNHQQAYTFLGAHEKTVDGIAGVLFATWAPNAERVSVVGDFNHWDGRRHPMRVRGSSCVCGNYLFLNCGRNAL